MDMQTNLWIGKYNVRMINCNTLERQFVDKVFKYIKILNDIV